MKIFKTRKNIAYKKEIFKKITIDSLMKTSQDNFFDNSNYAKLITIDFFGLSSTTLLDVGNSFTDGSIARAFEKIFKEMKKLNNKGYIFRIRFLFSYLYSDFAFNIIEAEKTQNRAAINDSVQIINFESDNDITEAEFYSSSTFRNQYNSLKQIQKITEKYNCCVEIPNKLAVRFTTIPINFCGFVINDFASFDAYSFSKKEKESELLSYSMPVIVLNKEKDNALFEEIEDHFRYLWNHETTLYCEDATRFDKNKSNSLTLIKKPEEINLTSKIQKIKDVLDIYGKDYSNSSSKAWEFRVRKKIMVNSRINQNFPSKETVFIACCWEEQEDRQYIPNKIAKEYNDLIYECFNETNTLTPLLVYPNPGSQMTEKIYSHLNQATLAIIVLTKDIESKEGDFYASQNVIHELGFMMNHLNAKQTGRLLILKEKNLKLPSNVSDFEHIEFEKNKSNLLFIDIIQWLYQKCGILTIKDIKNSFEIVKSHLNTDLQNGDINPKEFNSNLKKIHNFENSFNKK